MCWHQGWPCGLMEGVVSQRWGEGVADTWRVSWPYVATGTLSGDNPLRLSLAQPHRCAYAYLRWSLMLLALSTSVGYRTMAAEVLERHPL